MRVLLLNQFYPPDIAPTGRVLHDLGRALALRGHDVQVICSRGSYEGGQRFAAHETFDGVTVHRLPAFGFGRRGFAGKLADYASFYTLLATRLLFMHWHPDVILSLTTPPYLGLLGKYAAAWHRGRHLHWIMDIYPDVMNAHGMASRNGLLYRGLQTLTRRQLEGATLAITLGPCMAERVASYMNGDLPVGTIQAVPLWGDPALVPWPVGQPNPLREQRGWGEEELVLMYSGNMGLGHRFEEFVAGAARLGSSGPRWVFVGGGKRRSELEALALAKPSARIEFLPYVPREHLCASLCSADLHLVSLDSAWQGLMVPSKLQEIFALGKPVLFVGGRKNEIAAWIEESGGGWCVAENDIEGLLAAISQAGNRDERERRGRAALAFARAHFDMRKNCDRLVRAIEDNGAIVSSQ